MEQTTIVAIVGLVASLLGTTVGGLISHITAIEDGSPLELAVGVVLIQLGVLLDQNGKDPTKMSLSSKLSVSLEYFSLTFNFSLIPRPLSSKSIPFFLKGLLRLYVRLGLLQTAGPSDARRSTFLILFSKMCRMM